MASHGESKEEDQFPPLIPLVYDFLLWALSITINLFFREIHPRGTWRVPQSGPVIFVAAPHANQFVDSIVVMRVLRNEAKRRISNIIAAHSMKRGFIGTMAGSMGSIPVGRAQDLAKSGTGRVYLPDPINDPTLIRGVDTKFDQEAEVGGLLMLPKIGKSAGSSQIAEIISAEELRVKKPFEGEAQSQQLTGRKTSGQDGQILSSEFSGSSFKLAPKVDQSDVYDSVFKRLGEGGAICIFPEGGSHDRTELLPLKAGVAIMALGTLAKNPDCGLKIVSCGMNYFHAHKFRSRAVIEFGSPYEVPSELVKLYQSGNRREATRQLLEIIYENLVAVTVQAPDYETLMLIQTARRLYKPKGKKLPLPMVIELNRRMIKGYTQYKDDPRIISLKKSINDYSRTLWRLGVRDHQVEYAKFSIHTVLFALIYRVLKLLVLVAATLPGLVLFAPVFVTSKLISIQKSREALAASNVKIHARDVVATWKITVALAVAPAVYLFYTTVACIWTYHNRIQGLIPKWVPVWIVFVVCLIISITFTFAALRLGEIGMDIFKSLRPLALSLNPSSANTFQRLRRTRQELSAQITELVNELGPEMFPDFDRKRMIPAAPKEDADEDPRRVSLSTSVDTHTTRSASRSRSSSESSGTFSKLTRAFTADSVFGPGELHTKAHEPLPRNESFSNLGNLSFFATRPPSRSRSRPGTAASKHPEGLTLTSREGLEEVTKRIRGAMHERRKERERRRSESSWEIADGSGAVTPGSEDKKDV